MNAFLAGRGMESKRRRSLRRTLLLALAGWMLGAVAFAPAPLGSPGVPRRPSGVERLGWLSIVHGDGEPGSGLAPRLEYRLVDERGGSTPITFTETMREEKIAALRGQRVRVVGEWAAEAAAGEGARPLQAAEITAAGGAGDAASAGAAPEALSGSQPWVSVMCRFADYQPPATPDPKPLSYFLNMYASTEPGLDHYWREVSYDNINVLGSMAVGWYNLPHNRAYYLPGGHLDWGLAAEECTALADPDVNFHSFTGINLMFNYDLDGYAWGGGVCLEDLDGSFGCWHMTWEPPWGYRDIVVIEHEMGHGFGLPHSSGSYGATYDNQWDVMSDTWSNCWRPGVRDLVYGCTGQHTIAYHKDKLGWIPSARELQVDPGQTITVTLERLDSPAFANYQLVRMPIAGSPTRFYTIEARQITLAPLSTYDIKLPGAGVIIHQVDTSRSIQAHVIDIDGNHNTGDAGAMWVPGETFLASPRDTAVSVLYATDSGWVVQVTNGEPWLSFLPAVMR